MSAAQTSTEILAKIPTSEAYQAAFQALETSMTETRFSLLRTHYHMPHRQCTMTQIAEKMGWHSYVSGNRHYGCLAKLLAQELGFDPGDCQLNTICTFIRPAERGDHYLLTMHPQVAETLETLGWV